MWRSGINRDSILGMALCCQLKIYHHLETITLDSIRISHESRSTIQLIVIQTIGYQSAMEVDDMAIWVMQRLSSSLTQIPSFAKKVQTISCRCMFSIGGTLGCTPSHPELDFPTFSLGLMPPAQSYPGRLGTSYAPSPPDIVGSSFQVPPPPSTVGSLFQPLPLPGKTGSSTPHMPISYASSSDSDEHNDERTYDAHRHNSLSLVVVLNSSFYAFRVYFYSFSYHDTNTVNIPEHVPTVTQMVSDELSMLYPTVDVDDDENDHSDEDYAVSSESKDDDNTDAEEEDIQTPSSQWFNNARYDYTQSEAFLDMGSDAVNDNYIHCLVLMHLQSVEKMTTAISARQPRGRTTPTTAIHTTQNSQFKRHQVSIATVKTNKQPRTTNKASTRWRAATTPHNRKQKKEDPTAQNMHTIYQLSSH
ncbi:hypothetical protein M9H77_33940 [Catharanthus roseus]|uniref:Uncharacterized protein n=1 Tax=Catharanthus roseus TaxID=4058 RepID=A0ACB9ZNC3_CATRO|nr:hypothetical protein M9H77_33940 [Catharanthus roseus]